jgi:hypothetical protein
MKFRILVLLSFSMNVALAQAEQIAGNPLFKGWYADLEGIIFDDEYWIYPTY